MDFLEHLKNSLPEEDAIKLYESLDLEDEHAVRKTLLSRTWLLLSTRT